MNIDIYLNENGLQAVIKSVASLVSSSKDPDFVVEGARLLGELGRACINEEYKSRERIRAKERGDA